MNPFALLALQLLFVFFATLGVAWDALLIRQFWNWFLVPSFHYAKRITYLNALGFALAFEAATVGLALSGPDVPYEQMPNFVWENITDSVLYVIFTGCFLFGGWVVVQFRDRDSE